MDSNSAFSVSNLLCLENEACFNKEVDEGSYLLNPQNFLFSENDEEYIEMLVKRESNFECRKHESFDDSSMGINRWLQYARLDSIEWILKTRAFFGFGFQTAYLSITYFDRFLSKRSIDGEKPWAVRLLSVACLTLASKMEEHRVPALSEFQVEDYNFEDSVIQKMELLVLNTLEWRMFSITPFTYIIYFITKLCDESRPRQLICKTVDLIVAVAKERSLLCHRPSVIAAAAVLAAMDQTLTKKSMEFKMSLISSCGSIQNVCEHVFSCYNLLQELEMGKVTMSRFIVSPDLSPIYSNSAKFTEESALNPSDGATPQRRKERKKRGQGE